MGSPAADDLRDDLIKTASKKGIEVARTGGALGMCNRNDSAFREFLQQRAKPSHWQG